MILEQEMLLTVFILYMDPLIPGKTDKTRQYSVFTEAQWMCAQFQCFSLDGDRKEVDKHKHTLTAMGLVLFTPVGGKKYKCSAQTKPGCNQTRLS